MRGGLALWALWAAVLLLYGALPKLHPTEPLIVAWASVPAEPDVIAVHEAGWRIEQGCEGCLSKVQAWPELPRDAAGYVVQAQVAADAADYAGVLAVAANPGGQFWRRPHVVALRPGPEPRQVRAEFWRDPDVSHVLMQIKQRGPGWTEVPYLQLMAAEPIAWMQALRWLLAAVALGLLAVAGVALARSARWMGAVAAASGVAVSLVGVVPRAARHAAVSSTKEVVPAAVQASKGLGLSVDDLGHVVMHAVVAALVGLALSDRRSVWPTVLGFAVSAEALQLLTRDRSPSLDDAVLNVVGAGLGLALAWAISRARRGATAAGR